MSLLCHPGLAWSLPVILPYLFPDLPGARAAAASGVYDPPGLGNLAVPFPSLQLKDVVRGQQVTAEVMVCTFLAQKAAFSMPVPSALASEQGQ